MPSRKVSRKKVSKKSKKSNKRASKKVVKKGNKKTSKKVFKCPGLAKKLVIKNGKIVELDAPYLFKEIHKHATRRSKNWMKDDFYCNAGIRSDEGFMKTKENEYLRQELLNEMNAINPSFVQAELTPEEREFENIVILGQYLQSLKYPQTWRQLPAVVTISDVKQLLLS